MPSRLDLPLLLLTLVLTVTPLALTNLTYSIESIKVLVFQMGTALLLLVTAAKGGSPFGQGRGLDHAVIAYFGINFLAFYFSDLKEPGLTQLYVLTYQVLFYLLVRSQRMDERRFGFLSTCWIAAALAASLAAVAQVVFEIYVRYGVPWMSRATGTFLQPTFLGSYLSATLPIVVWRFFHAGRNRDRALLGVVLGVIVIALGFSLSRSGWIGAAVGLTVLAALEQRYITVERITLPVVAGLLVSFWIVVLWRPPQRLDLERLDPKSRSSVERLHIWKGSLEMALERPILGYGPGTFGAYFLPHATPFLQEIYVKENQRANHAHSEPLQILTESGLVGLGSWLVLVGWAALTLWRTTRQGTAQEQRLARIHLPVMAALLTNAAIGLDQRFATSSMLLWYVLGVAASYQPAPPGGGESAQRKPLLIALSLYLLWIPWPDFRADNAKMLGASAQYASQPAIAATYLEIARQNRPADAELHFLLGRNWTILGDLAKAEVAYLEALRLDPNNPALMYNLARVYRRAGQFREAKELLWKALEVCPKFELVAQELMKVENMSREM